MSGESPGLRGILGAVRERLAAFRALWRDFTGESAYEKYVARHRREHPGHAPRVGGGSASTGRRLGQARHDAAVEGGSAPWLSRPDWVFADQPRRRSGRFSDVDA